MRTTKQFTHFKLIFGTYLFWHFSQILPYAEEIFTSRGMISNRTLLFADEFIKHLSFIDSNIQIFIVILMICSISLTFNYNVRLASGILWCGWVYLFNSNVFIANPGIPYVGLLLLVCMLPYHKNTIWIMWFLMMMGYTVSGIHKLQCQTWLDGTALLHIVTNPIGRNNILTHMFINLPLPIIKFATWSSLFLEITSLIFGCFYHMRKWYWCALVSMHIGVMLLLNFTDLTLGILMVHVYTFDTKWF
jgi:hypothetical protein